jgi:surfactin synthase thioesterase subunit
MADPERRGWLRRRARGARIERRLVCFHHAGGGASVFRGWENALAPGSEVVAVQLPGREGRIHEPPIRDVGEVIEALAPHVAPLLDRPYDLFGHSVGALLAFELARRIRSEGWRQPERLFAAAARPPSAWRRPAEPPAARAQVPPDDVVVDRLRQYGGTPTAVLEHPGLMEMLLPMLRADFALAERYRYEPGEPLACDIVALVGDADRRVRVDHARGWARETAGRFVLRELAGSHFFVHESREDVLVLIAQLPPRAHASEGAAAPVRG